MATSVAPATMRARCPLCGSPVLSVGPHGLVSGEDFHAIPIGPEQSWGYTVCDDCAVLANLPTHLTLN